MSEQALPLPDRFAHEHEWRLVSIEVDGAIEVRESVCTGCSAVLFEE